MKIETGVLITGIKIKYLSKKQNADGENHMFQVLDEKQMNDIFKLAEENMKIPVWKYDLCLPIAPPGPYRNLGSQAGLGCL